MNCLKTLRALRIATLLCVVLHCQLFVSAQGIYQNWGVTYDGGPDNIGGIFSTDSAGGNLTAQHFFNLVYKGGRPQFSSLTAYNNKLYSLATSDLSNSGRSVLFEYDPATAAYAVKALIPGREGYGPWAFGTLLEYNNKLYGVANTGGAFGVGEIFSYDPASGLYSKLVDFVEASGSFPNGKLTLFNNKMYGVTVQGGKFGTGGVVFEFDPQTNVYQAKADLLDAGGSFAGGGLTLFDNKLYGLTSAGGLQTSTGETAGLLYEFDPVTSAISTKFEFTEADGYGPQGNLFEFGNTLWGVTPKGGSNGAGVIFQYDPAADSYTKKIDLVMENGSFPLGDLTTDGNKLFGATFGGGIENNGALFEYDPLLNTYTKRFDFTKLNGTDPSGSLTYYNNTFYGLASEGGTADDGVIFEYNPVTTVYTKKIDFGYSNASYPSGNLSYFNKNLYGVAAYGGTVGTGVIFKFDLASRNTSVEYNFDTLGGSNPTGNMVFTNNQFYGMTVAGGDSSRGVIYSYNPNTKAYSKLHDFDSASGGNSTRGIDQQNTSGFLLYNSKLYGVTSFGGTGNYGVLFEFDPLTNAYTKKIDFDSASGKNPSGTMAVEGNIMYGVTTHGGAEDDGVLFKYDPVGNIVTKIHDVRFPEFISTQNNLSVFDNKIYGASAYGGDAGYAGAGFLFEYDPAADTYTRKYSFDYAAGAYPFAGLLVKNNLFYGTTSYGGVNDKGVVFEYNPLTNVYIKKADFDSTSNGSTPSGLISIPAAVAAGNIGTCTALPVFTIDNANNNTWKGITNEFGEAIAEINPNGNDLGNISASLYVQNNPVRNAGGLNYLNRSLTITVQNQPAAGHPVDVRLYITKAELDDLINTPGSGISSINDLTVYKSEDPCSNNIGNDVVKLTTTAAEWGVNYVLTTQVNSFSTFHFSSVSAALPVTLLQFTATRRASKENQLNWQTSSEINSSYFSVERSTDALHFIAAGNVVAAGTSAVKKEYQYVDVYTSAVDLYYRLKMVDKDGRFKYSKIVKLAAGDAPGISISPNPVINTLTINGAIHFKQLQIIDASGKTVRQFTASASNQYNVSNLQPGVYMLRFINDKDIQVQRFIKQ